MNLYERALELKQETISHRRYLHQNAEVGLDTPKAKAYVIEQLRKCGMEPVECGHGVMATLGQPGKTLLLRADMDALPMTEESGLDFACTTGATHACGHDCHAAMLLTAAKLLKEREGELKGSVRFMFQPGEETFEGSRDMIKHGILEPKPDAALAFHVAAGRMPLGLYLYNNTREAMMFSVDGFQIAVTGRGSHGAYPHQAIDPINIGVHIHLALQELIARECDPSKACVLTIGQFSAGTAANIIPETAVLKGTIRTNDAKERAMLVRRLQAVSQATAAVFGGTAVVTWDCQVPTLVCDPDVVNAMAGYMGELPVPGLVGQPGIKASASEDFALIAEQVPSAFFYLSAGFQDEQGDAAAHNPKVRFHEDALPMGAAGLAHCALRWLEEH